jgi:exosortase/archaeosortase family protein
MKEKKRKSNYLVDLIIRLLALIFVSLNFGVFYFVFTPITVYLSYFLTKIFYDSVLIGNTIGIGSVGFNFIEACIAGAAYYLLFILIMGIKEIKWLDRLKVFVVGALLILGMNLIRVLVLIMLNVELGKNYFDAVHLVFWNFLSGVFIALVWIFLVKKYKLGEIPYFEDIKYLYNNSFLKKRKSEVERSDD